MKFVVSFLLLLFVVEIACSGNSETDHGPHHPKKLRKRIGFQPGYYSPRPSELPDPPDYIYENCAPYCYNPPPSTPKPTRQPRPRTRTTRKHHKPRTTTPALVVDQEQATTRKVFRQGFQRGRGYRYGSK